MEKQVEVKGWLCSAPSVSFLLSHTGSEVLQKMKSTMKATLVGPATFQGHPHWPSVPQPGTSSDSHSQLITRASQSLLGPEDLETRIVRDEKEEGKDLLR